MLERRNTLAFYDIYPKIVPVGREVTFTVRSMDPHLMQDFPFRVKVRDLNGGGGSSPALYADVPITPLAAPQHGFTFTVTLPREEEYQIYIDYDGKKRPRAVLSVYALEEDLLCRKPLIGDFHGHTYYSDGKEGPAFVAAEYRKNGFDFVTVTDHRRRQPSLLAVEAFKDLDLPFKIYPGEEVHPHGIHMHVVNFASDRSANLFALRESTLETWVDTSPTPEWDTEIEAIKATLTDLPEGVDPNEVASAMIVSRIIREGGGLSILAHPHWYWQAHNVPDVTTRYLFEKGVFDALELIGGLHWYENDSQIAYYEKLTAEGVKIPVVGSSDQHSVLPYPYPAERLSYFTEESTLVFAKDNTRDAITDAVKELYSTAVLKYAGQFPRICGGSYRIKCYTNFLLREYFPLREELYATEGRLMHEYNAGTPGAREQLLQTVAYHAYFEDKYFLR
ncbi:MAG: hypothetical protein E7663_05240 [Ruminococcaceae bacterium]|nr:hypothetical protein [Oscillospiraceae bacterium]